MTDPFDVLLAPTDPIQPPARFAADLRRRLVEAIADAPVLTPSPAQEAAMSTITPYLIVRNATEMLDFYRNAFGAVVSESLVDDNGRVGHAELSIGTSRLQLADEFPEFDILSPLSRGGGSCSFTLEVDDVDAAFAKAVELGATVRTEPADQFHGNRTANVVDPAGHQWMLLAKIEDLSPEQYAARAKASGGYEVRTGSSVEQAAGTDSEVGGSPDRHQLKRHGVGDLYYFNIPVADPAKAAAFYREVLGWDVRDGHISNISAPPGSIGNYFTPEQGGIRMWFVVEDIQAAVAKVRELGGTADEPTVSESGWSAECRDDQGTLFCLSVPSEAYSL